MIAPLPAGEPAWATTSNATAPTLRPSVGAAHALAGGLFEAVLEALQDGRGDREAFAQLLAAQAVGGVVDPCVVQVDFRPVPGPTGSPREDNSPHALAMQRRDLTALRAPVHAPARLLAPLSEHLLIEPQSTVTAQTTLPASVGLRPVVERTDMPAGRAEGAAVPMVETARPITPQYPLPEGLSARPAAMEQPRPLTLAHEPAAQTSPTAGGTPAPALTAEARAADVPGATNAPTGIVPEMAAQAASPAPPEVRPAAGTPPAPVGAPVATAESAAAATLSAPSHGRPRAVAAPLPGVRHDFGTDRSPAPRSAALPEPVQLSATWATPPRARPAQEPQSRVQRDESAPGSRADRVRERPPDRPREAVRPDRATQPDVAPRARTEQQPRERAPSPPPAPGSPTESLAPRSDAAARPERILPAPAGATWPGQVHAAQHNRPHPAHFAPMPTTTGGMERPAEPPPLPDMHGLQAGPSGPGVGLQLAGERRLEPGALAAGGQVTPPEGAVRTTDADAAGGRAALAVAPAFLDAVKMRAASPLPAAPLVGTLDGPRDLELPQLIAATISPASANPRPAVSPGESVVVEAASRAPLPVRVVTPRGPVPGEAAPVSAVPGAAVADLLHHRAATPIGAAATTTGSQWTPLAQADRVEQVAAAVERAGREGLGRLEVQLPWDGLGVTRLVVQLSALRARVELACVSPESLAATRMLEAPVRERLESQGFQLQDFHATPDDGRRQDAWQQQAAWSEGRPWQPEAPAPPSRPAPPARPPSGTGGGGLLDVFV